MIENNYKTISDDFKEKLIEHNLKAKKLNFKLTKENYKFISVVPYKYYNLNVSNQFYSYLFEKKSEDQGKFIKAFELVFKEIGPAIRTLSEINIQNIHEKKADLSERATYLIELHRLIEGVMLDFVNIPAILYLTFKDKKTKGLTTLSNTKDVINKTKFNGIIKDEVLFIRNALAHVNYSYSGTSVEFYNKSEKKEFRLDKLIKVFDEVLDICNGFYIALLTFYKENIVFFQDHIENHPIELLNKLLILEDYYFFEILKIESARVGEKKQLQLELEFGKISKNEIAYSLLTLLKEINIIYKDYDQIFIKQSSKSKTKTSFGYCLIETANLKKDTFDDFENISDFMSKTTLNFDSKIKYSKFRNARKILKLYLKTSFLDTKIATNKFPEYRLKKVEYMEWKLRKAVALVEILSKEKKETARKNYKKINRKILSRLILKNPLMLFKVRYLEIVFFTEELREREVYESGLHENILGISKRSDYKNFRLIGVVNSTHEKLGRNHMFWNNNFKEK